MAARITTYRIGSARRKREGLRIGTVRYLPRGVSKRDYSKRDLFDVWLPELAPSGELLRRFTAKPESLSAFFRAYRAEMKRPTARRLVELLVKIAERTPLAVGCYCDDESRCHRLVLIKLLEAASRRRP